MKELYQKNKNIEDSQEKIDVNGIKVSKKLLNRESKNPCPICSKMFFRVMDDVTMTKYNCCFACYVKYVENREERWLEGWRPNEDHESTN